MGELAKYQVGDNEIVIREEDIPYLVEGGGRVTPKEAMRFAMLCASKNLNPWLREVFLIKYSDDKPATIVVGKQYYERAISNSPLIGGLRSGVVVERNGELEYRQDGIVPPGTNLVGGWAEVYRRDWDHPVRVAVNLKEYIQYTKDERGNIVPNTMWRTKPATMITKVAEEQAMRRALPDQLGGVYAPEEMGYDEDALAGRLHNSAANSRPPEMPTNTSFQSPTSAPPSNEAPAEGELIEASAEPSLEPEPEPEPVNEEERQAALKRLFAALNDLAKARAKAAGESRSMRREVEEEVRAIIQGEYGKISLKSLTIEEAEDLRAWALEETARLRS